MIQRAVQGCGRRQGASLQIDVLCWARSLHKLFIIQLKGFAAKHNCAFKPLSKTSKMQLFFQREMWILFLRDFLKHQPKKYSSPHWLCNRFSGIFWDKHVAGKSVVGRVLRNETKIPADGKQSRTFKAEGTLHIDGTVWWTSFFLFVLMQKVWW